MTKRLLAVLLGAAACIASPRAARADIFDDLGEAARDAEHATDKPGPYRSAAIELNPLGLFAGGRFSVNVEYVPVAHHALIVSPHIVHTSANLPISTTTTGSETFSGAGAEIGYRYYSGHRGPNGLFVGPSVILGAYNANLLNSNQVFTSIGLAGDVGVQYILFDWLTFSVGAGLQYTQVSHDFSDLPFGASITATGGLKPRLLVAAGYAF
jgi:hypothetical protein